MDLRELASGMRLEGLVEKQTVTLLSVSLYGASAAEVTFKKEDGSIDHQILYAEDASIITRVDENTVVPFSADGRLFQIASEAERIHLAYLFDPFLAVHTSAIDPLPHQISAVYEDMLPKHPLRYVLADDPGAGKTIMTGLLLKELMIRGDVERCMIVCPGNLVEQWQDELSSKFGLHFEIMTNDMLESAASGNAFQEHPYLIARLDKLSRDETLIPKIEVTNWDIVVIDEAHKLSASVLGSKVKYTKRYNLGKLLSRHTRHFLLLTATPHNGNEADFQQFMALVDEDRFECKSKTVRTNSDVSDVMRRLVKEDLLKFDGTPLFPERRSTTVPYSLSPMEQDLYENVTEYVRDQFNRAEKLKNDKKQAVGFALTVLQRRLASSPEAIYQSLRRRKERLEKRMSDILQHKETEDHYALDDDDIDSIDDVPDDEAEGMEDSFLDNATAAKTVDELKAEIGILDNLESDAARVRASGKDKKWDEVSSLLQSPAMIAQDGKREKIIIFTEHKDTLNYLTQRIRTLLGDKDAVVNIFGGMRREERKHIEELFRQDKDTSVLVATDAAGEGINLQRAHLMINYDLPWNPNRIEQRFGRIHRIGQTEICQLWNIVAKDTREGQVYDRLLTKLEQERKNLGGKVFDILGKLTFGDKPLKDLLVEAIRYGNDPVNKAKLFTVVDNAVDTKHLVDLLDDHALTKEVMSITDVNRIKEEMERMNARRLQPYYIKLFFENAFAVAHGSVNPREHGRYEISRVPGSVISMGHNVLSRYERICFEKEDVNVEGKPIADLLCPGHPLLDALVSWILNQYAPLLKEGAILVDSLDRTDQPRIMYSIDTSIRDGVKEQGKEHVISEQMCFVELHGNDKPMSGGYAPYLDYLPLKPEQEGKAKELLARQTWIGSDADKMALQFAVTDLMPRILSGVRSKRLEKIEKVAHEVDARLTTEINYWDNKGNLYQERLKKQGPNPGVFRQMESARDNATELARRRTERLRLLEMEKHITPIPPVVHSMALVIPKSLLETGTKESTPLYGADKKAVELKAMAAVMDIEKKFGNIPNDVSSMNLGYDVESRPGISDNVGKGSMLRLVEVKGRCTGHDDIVTVTRNEILTAMNCPGQFYLALVTVNDNKTVTTYCMPNFVGIMNDAMNSVNFDVEQLLSMSTIVYDERKGE